MAHSGARPAFLIPWAAPQPTDPAPWSLDTSRRIKAPGVERILIIASLPRSGSSLLSRALGETGELGRPEEYFNPHILANHRAAWGLPRLTMHGRAGIIRRRLAGDPSWWVSFRYSERSLQRYCDSVVAGALSPSGRFGVKIHWAAYEAFADGPLDPLTWGLPVDWIHLRRGDVLRQAISFVRARQTSSWHSDRPESAVPTYDAPEIARVLDRLHEWEASWRGFFAAREITPLEMAYEDLAAGYEQEVRRALDYLGLHDAPVPAPPLTRQADDLTEEWAARFAHDRAALDGTP